MMSTRLEDVLGLPQAALAGGRRADELIRLIAEHEGLEAEMRALRAQGADKSLSLNETARLRMRMREADGRRERVADEIREICNG